MLIDKERNAIVRDKLNGKRRDITRVIALIYRRIQRSRIRTTSKMARVPLFSDVYTIERDGTDRSAFGIWVDPGAAVQSRLQPYDGELPMNYFTNVERIFLSRLINHGCVDSSLQFKPQKPRRRGLAHS